MRPMGDIQRGGTVASWGHRYTLTRESKVTPCVGHAFPARSVVATGRLTGDLAAHRGGGSVEV